MNNITINIATRQTELRDELIELVQMHGSEDLKKILSNNPKTVTNMLKHSKTIIAAPAVKEYLKQHNGTASVRNIARDLNLSTQLVYSALKVLDANVDWEKKTHTETITITDDVYAVASI